MKRGNLAFKVVTALFFIAVLAYIGVYFYNSIENPFSVTAAVSHTVYDSIDAMGILIREEIPITTDYETVYVTAEEAKRLPNNGVVAYTYSSQSNLDRAVEIRNIKTQIDYLESFGNDLNTSDPLQLQYRLKDGIVHLKKTLLNRELASLEDMSINLRSLAFFDGSNTSDIEQSLTELNNRLYELGYDLDSDASFGTGKITVPSAGLFTGAVDGFESVSPDILTGLTPGSLSVLLEEDRSAPGNMIGKIVCGSKWYYAAIIDTDESKNLSVGNTALLIFGKYYNEQLNMTVESIGDDENGACIVVFSCDHALADTINMRKQSAEILKSSYSGIKVPKKAVRLDEEGNGCVYVMTGLRVEKKTVSIIYEDGDFYLLAIETERSDALRLGDSVIVSAKDLYDGKVIG